MYNKYFIVLKPDLVWWVDPKLDWPEAETEPSLKK